MDINEHYDVGFEFDLKEVFACDEASLNEYAAFYGSIKCFKYLVTNDIDFNTLIEDKLD